jgi:membrane protease YdiL (CAAX protease family)
MNSAHKKARVWHLFVLFLVSQIAVVVLTAGAAIFIAASRKGVDDAELVEGVLSDLAESPDVLLLSILFGFAESTGLALLVGIFSPQPFVERLRLGRSRLSLAELVVASLGFLALSNASDAVLRLLPGYAEGGIAVLNRLFQKRDVWMAVLLAGVAVPVGEELFYRGALQTRFAERFGRTAGLVVASMLFALAHFEPIHMLFALAAGLYLGWLSDVAGSCRASLAAHALNNTVATVGAGWMASFEREMATAPVAAACGMLALASVVWLARRTRDRPTAAPGDGTVERVA